MSLHLFPGRPSLLPLDAALDALPFVLTDPLIEYQINEEDPISGRVFHPSGVVLTVTTSQDSQGITYAQDSQGLTYVVDLLCLGGISITGWVDGRISRSHAPRSVRVLEISNNARLLSSFAEVIGLLHLFFTPSGKAFEAHIHQFCAQRVLHHNPQASDTVSIYSHDVYTIPGLDQVLEYMPFFISHLRSFDHPHVLLTNWFNVVLPSSAHGRLQMLHHLVDLNDIPSLFVELSLSIDHF